MLHTNWLRWAGRLSMIGALALGALPLRAQDEAAKRDSAARTRNGDPAPAENTDRGSRRTVEPSRPESADTSDRGSRRSAEASRPEGADFWLGLNLYPAQGVIRDQLKLPEGQGLAVEFIAPEGPAAKAGVQKSDILLSGNDKPLGNLRQLVEVLSAAEGKAISFKLLRGGQETTLSITPEKNAPRSAGRNPEGRNPEGNKELDRAWQQWREQGERGGEPLRMRFFHPGMVLPPGTSTQPPLPDDMRVTITREGQKPAQVEIKQGDETWKASEDDLSKLPDKVRGPVEGMLGRAPIPASVRLQAREAGAPGDARGRDSRLPAGDASRSDAADSGRERSGTGRGAGAASGSDTGRKSAAGGSDAGSGAGRGRKSTTESSSEAGSGSGRERKSAAGSGSEAGRGSGAASGSDSRSQGRDANDPSSKQRSSDERRSRGDAPADSSPRGAGRTPERADGPPAPPPARRDAPPEDKEDKKDSPSR